MHRRRHFTLRTPVDQAGVVVAPIVCEVLATQAAKPEALNPSEETVQPTARRPADAALPTWRHPHATVLQVY